MGNHPLHRLIAVGGSPWDTATADLQGRLVLRHAGERPPFSFDRHPRCTSQRRCGIRGRDGAACYIDPVFDGPSDRWSTREQHCAFGQRQV